MSNKMSQILRSLKLWKPQGRRVAPHRPRMVGRGDSNLTSEQMADERRQMMDRVNSQAKRDVDSHDIVTKGYGHEYCVSPNTKFRRIWDITQIFVLLYISFMAPIRVGYSQSPEGPMFVFEFLIDVYFYIDVILNFFTGFEADDGVLVFDLRLIRSHYMKSWFGVDVLACLPIDLLLRGLDGTIECSFRGDCIDSGSGGASAIRMLKVLRLARLIKLIRLVGIKRIIARYENQLFNIMPLINIGWLVFVLLFIGHLTGCFFYFFSTTEFLSKYEDARESWLFHEFAGESVLITEEEKDAWLERGDGQEYSQKPEDRLFQEEWVPGKNVTMWRTPFSISERYIASMYWAFTTMTTVGYGDISATHKAERMFAIIGMIIGGFVFSLIIGNISKMMEKMAARKKAYNDKLDVVAVFLKDLPALSKDLRNRILAYYRKQSSIVRIYDTKQLLGEMPFELRSGILLHMYKGVTEKVEFLQGHLDEVFITDVCSRLVPHSTPPQTFVYQRGEEGGGMFIIVKGELWVLDLDKKSLLQRLTRNDYFGESSLLTYLTVTGEDVPKRTENVLSVSTSDLLVLSLNDLVELCKTYPHMHTSLKETHEVRGELYRSKQANAAAGAIAILQRKARRTAKDVAAVYHSHLRNIVTLKHKARMAERKGSVELVEAETKLDKILSGGRRVSKDSRPSIGSATGSGRSLREDSKESSTAPEAETGGLLSIPAGPPPDRVPMWTHAGKGSVPVASRASDGDTKPPHRPPASGAFAPKTAEELVIMEEVGPSDDVGTVIKAVKLQLGLLTQQSLELDRKVADMGAAGPAALAELRAVQAEQMGRVMDIAAQVVGGL
mmetsp:Transcript_58003/g.184251  ORF Transcript_58003/g.184251 Transcript_58003/m.184251 type:complete len:838 (+) Transcript_58003:206-2719(+)